MDIVAKGLDSIVFTNRLKNKNRKCIGIKIYKLLDSGLFWIKDQTLRLPKNYLHQANLSARLYNKDQKILILF